MRRIFGCLLVVAVLTLGASATAHATHNYGGRITWERDTSFVSTTSARFQVHVEAAFRWSYLFASGERPAVGTQFGAQPGGFVFTYGSTTLVTPLIVTSISLPNDSMVGARDITLTVPLSSLPFSFRLDDCCRKETLPDGNASKPFRLETTITTAGGATKSPRASVPLRVPGEVDLPIVFDLPAFDVDGLPTQFRLATAAESGLVTPAPPGLTLSTGGRVTWAPTAKGFYSVQFIAENSSGAKAPYDVLFDVAAASPRPSFNAGLCGSTVPVYVGLESATTVIATVPPGIGSVTVAASGLVSGMVFTSTGASATSSTNELRWVPGLGQGSANVCFLATAASGATNLGTCCVTLQITTVTPPGAACGVKDGVSLLPADYASTSLLRGTAALGPSGQLMPINFGQASNSSSAIWLAGTPQPIGNGFSLQFTFTLKKNTPQPSSAAGFAVVLQSNGPTALGGTAGGLGYAGIDHALAIEFDSHQDIVQSDPSYQHIAVHSGYAAQVSANEQSSLGTSMFDNALQVGFDNGTTQNVRIEYRPAVTNQAGGGTALGTLKTYLNANVTPSLEVQVNDAALADALGDSAYFGFTTSSGTVGQNPGTADSQLLISNVKLLGSLGANGQASTTPQAIVAGSTGQFIVQALDQCGVPRRTGGEVDKWNITMTDGPAPLPTTIVDNRDGTYAVRYTPPVSGTWHANASFAGAAIPGSPFTISAVAPTVPPPQIVSPVDGYTSTDHAVTVLGLAYAGATVIVYDGGSIVGTIEASPAGTFSVPLSLVEGAHSLTALQTQYGASSEPSAPITLHIQPLPPIITSPPDNSIGASPSLMVTGTAMPGATINGTKIAGGAPTTPLPELVVGPEGTFSIPLAPLTPGGAVYVVTLTQTVAGETSGPATVHVTMPDFPAVISGVPANITVEATGPGTPVIYPLPTAIDPERGPVPVNCIPFPGPFPVRTTVVSCTAQDSMGKVSTATFTVTVTDKLPPVFGPVSDVVVEATGPAGAAVTLAPVATDLVDGALTATCVPASGSTFALGTTSATCTATDAHGNSSSTQLTVTVRDTTPPALTVGADVTVEATSHSGATVAYAAPTAHDLVDGDLSGSVHCLPASGTTFATGTTTVSCTVADAAGNAATKSLSIKVFDSTGPTFTAPADVTVEADGASGAFVTYPVPTATDTVDGQVPVTCVPSSGSLFPIGETLVHCLASDEPGNVTTKTFKVTVTDVSPPQLGGVPAGGLVEATGLAGAIVTYATPSATDTVDGVLPVSCLPASGSLFPLGLNVVLCQATDSSGHVAQASFPVTVVDTTPPLLTLPGPLTAEATGPAGAAVTFALAATDLVAGPTPVLCSASSGDVFPLGSTIVQCSTADLFGNTSTGAFTILVKDTTAPTLTGVPAAQTVPATSATGAVVTYAPPTATDLAGGAIPVSCVPASGSTFPLGTTTVTCTAVDAAGNTAKATFTVTVRDNSGPVFGALPSPSAYATSTSGATVSYALPKAVDALDGQRPVTCTPASGSRFAPGTTTVTCKATDKNGNTTTATFKVKVTYQAPTDGKFFLQPINPDGSSIFKLGSTVPVKFELTGASNCIRNLVAKLTVTKVGDAVAGTVVEGTSTSGADSGNTFRYSGGQYVFNLSTKSLAKGTWLLKADLGDGVEHTVRISLK
jgi:hypothetical protein